MAQSRRGGEPHLGEWRPRAVLLEEMDDPIGIARFVNRRRWKAKSSRENLAVVLKEVELDHGAEPSDVSLVGAMNGERWCFPGVGHAPEFLVPVRRFLAEQILGRYLAKLTRKQSGWEPLRDAARGDIVLSPAPVSAFVGGDGCPYMSGSLARIANDEGMVFVMFGYVSPPAPSESGSENMGLATSGSSSGVSQLATDGLSTTMLDERELWLDYREAMVAVREQRLQDLQQRVLELEETDRQHGQGDVENEPSRKEREEARKEAEEKTLDAIRALVCAENAGGGEALGETRRLLGASCIKSAASAYTVVAGVAERYAEDGCITELVKTAVRAVRDVLVMRCHAQVERREKNAFLATVEEAFGRPLDPPLLAVILLAYHKIIRHKFRPFPSKKQVRILGGGRPRPRRGARTGGDATDGPQREDGDDHETATRGPLNPTLIPEEEKNGGVVDSSSSTSMTDSGDAVYYPNQAGYNLHGAAYYHDDVLYSLDDPGYYHEDDPGYYREDDPGYYHEFGLWCPPESQRFSACHGATW